MQMGYLYPRGTVSWLKHMLEECVQLVELLSIHEFQPSNHLLLF